MEKQIKKISLGIYIATTVLIFITTLAFIACERDEPTPPPQVLGACDTTNVSFSSFIAPTIAKNCTSGACHNSPSAFGGTVILLTYDNIKTVGLSGNLAKGLNGAMGAYISQTEVGCDILKIQAWINKGAPNN